jgi:hypothetical protein
MSTRAFSGLDAPLTPPGTVKFFDFRTVYGVSTAVKAGLTPSDPAKHPKTQGSTNSERVADVNPSRTPGQQANYQMAGANMVGGPTVVLSSGHSMPMTGLGTW